jgi:hypothetical protein
MVRHAVAVVAVAVLTAAVVPIAQSYAITAKEKMVTCKFGADAQRLKGPARKTFIRKCMADKDESRGPASASVPDSGHMAPPRQQ